MHDAATSGASLPVWDRLVAGAQRSAEQGRAAGRAGTGMPEHRPSVAVLACSDARVPPSIVFDQPAGELFVVRVAGNTAAASVRASLAYAIDELGVDLLVVLGHTGCGAVAAAASGTCTGELAPVVGPICRLASEHPSATPAELERLNVAETVADLSRHGATAAAAQDGRLQIVGAVYDLERAALDPITDLIPDQGD